MKKKKALIILLLAVCCAILALTAYSITALFAAKTGTGPKGFEGFKYFTIDSNILMAVMSGLLVFYCFMALSEGRLNIPEKIMSFELIGTSAVTLTMLTVLIFLWPTKGADLAFGGTNLLMHVITPVLAILAFLLLEAVTKVPFRAVIFSMIPMLVYGTVYGIMTFTGIWEDFYGFVDGGFAALSAVIMVAAQFVIAFALRLAHNRITAARAAKEAAQSSPV